MRHRLPFSAHRLGLVLLGLAIAGGAFYMGQRAPNEAAPASSPAEARRAKFLPPPDAAPEEWRAAVENGRRERSLVVLQAIVESRPGRDPSERFRLLGETMAALASLGPQSRLIFDDLLRSPHREVRLAAMNVFMSAFPSEREAMIVASLSDDDPVIRAKAKALREALR